MKLTILLPDELGRRVCQLPDRGRFVAEALRRALRERPDCARQETEKPSRWTRLAAEIAADPVHLDGYSEQLERDAREFREGFVFRHDRDSRST